MNQESLYEENVGRPPSQLPDDHPYRWQWEYRGTKKEREGGPAQLGLVDDEEDLPVFIEGQEEMF